jgi:steroid 5-alpha reductase family enzyme
MENLLITSGLVGGILFIYSILIFIIARITRDNSVMDIAYGPAFLIASGGALYLGNIYELLPAVMVGCIAAWAIRLGSRIFRKNLGTPEDARYAKWRNEWMEKGRFYFLVRSYLQVNLLQICLILIILAPAIWALSFPTLYNQWFVLAGFLVFCFGLAYETIADLQLDRFITGKKSGTESAILMTKGLFSLSRRPNYFGETLIWWGLAIMVLPLPFGYIAIISPLVITYIVTRITGPMLETAFLERYPEQYQHYIDTTSYFIPWFKKS